MYSHVTVGASKLTRAMRFYDAALGALGMKRTRTFKIAAAYALEGFSGVNEPFFMPALGQFAAQRRGLHELRTRSDESKQFQAAFGPWRCINHRSTSLACGRHST